uniref:AI-2E family transporter n=1 Tax=Clostridium sp. NkU-1 TaxID=1095009 RepID=UPI000A7704F8
MVVAGWNYVHLFALAMKLVGFISPFLLGGVMAFILNVPMRRIEQLLPLKEESKIRRPLSLCLTLVFVIGLLLLVTFVVMPQLFETVMSLQNSIPAFLTGLKEEAERLFSQNPEVADYINSIQIDWKSFLENVVGFLTAGAGTVLSSTVSAALSIISGMTTFVIALVFAIYILLQKETLSRQFQKLMRAFLPEEVTLRTLRS